MPVERDYDEVLGVPHDAETETIKDAYHRLAMKWHPDRNPDPDAEERFKEIDSRFQRRGVDLWRSESLYPDEAVLGTRRILPTLEGHLEVTIRPGVQPDEVLRLRGKGLPR